jgi:WD40 repeat protein
LSLTEDNNLISGGEDKIIKVWDKSTFSLLYAIEGHDDYIRVVAGLKDGRICSGSRDNTLRVWRNQEQEMVLKGHKLPIWAMYMTIFNGSEVAN